MSSEVLPVTDRFHICDYLEASAHRFPERLAVSDSDAVSLTYGELNDRANRIATFLVNHGVKPGDRVAVVLPKTTTAYTALFGIMKARAAYVPIDWSGPVERTRSILTSCEIRLAFVDPRCQGLEGAVDELVPIDSDSWNCILSNPPLQTSPGARRPDDLAYILYTSGSTGFPKGVMVTQHNAVSYVDWCAEMFGQSEEDRFGDHAPFHFAMCILDIFVPTKLGASVHLASEELGKKPKELARFIANRRITVWYSTPAILGLLAEFADLKSVDCSSLRVVLFAGEPFPIKKLRRLMELWPEPSYCNLWGSTETNACTYGPVPKPIPPDRAEPYPIGWTASHCAIMVVDDELKPVAPGEQGMMCISGSTVFPGYWGRETAFLERDGRRWYNTGDVVKQTDGEGLAYVGRRDRMVERRGYRIELAEVERGLYQHPAITEAGVVALPDPDAGVRIIAYLVASPGEVAPSIVDMKAFCNQHLPGFMNPDMFVFLEALPRTRSNKVDYQALIRRPL